MTAGFNTIFSNCGYSSLILYQNLTDGSFIKVMCNVESETMSLNVYSVTLKVVVLSCFLNGSFTRTLVI